MFEIRYWNEQQLNDPTICSLKKSGTPKSKAPKKMRPLVDTHMHALAGWGSYAVVEVCRCWMSVRHWLATMVDGVRDSILTLNCNIWCLIGMQSSHIQSRYACAKLDIGLFFHAIT